MGTISLIWRIATSPIWLLWSGYKGLWWVFGDTHAPATGGSKPSPVAAGAPKASAACPAADQRTAFEVVDSSPAALPLPKRPLRAGFAGTVLTSIGLLLALNALGATGVMSPERAMVTWLWATAATAVGSIFIVRRVVRKDRQRKGLFGMLRDARHAVAGTAAGACGWAAERAAKGARWTAGQASTVNARHNVAGVARSTFASACSAAKRAWSSIGKVAPPEVKTAA